MENNKKVQTYSVCSMKKLYVWYSFVCGSTCPLSAARLLLHHTLTLWGGDVCDAVHRVVLLKKAQS